VRKYAQIFFLLKFGVIRGIAPNRVSDPWRTLRLVMLARLNVHPGSTASAHRADAAPLEASPAIQVQHDTLSVALQEVALCDVLATIARQSDIRVVCPAQEAEPRRTLAFTAVPLAEGLQRLLAGTSYALVYTGAGPQRRLALRWPLLSQPSRRLR